MEGYSETGEGSYDVGSEVSEVETTESDFGDGDGVNDFDETYNEMNSGNETMKYSEVEGSDESTDTDPEEFETTDNLVDDELEDFDDSADFDDADDFADNADAEDVQEIESEDWDTQKASDMSTDESVDAALSDFDDGDVDDEDVDAADETEDVEQVSDDVADETEDVDTETAEEVAEETAEDTQEEVDTVEDTEDTDAEQVLEDTDSEEPEQVSEDVTDETEDVDTETAEEVAEDTQEEVDAVEDTEDADAEQISEDTDSEEPEQASENVTDETDDVDTETAEDTPEETAEDTPEETAEETPEETAEDTPEETAEDTPEETAEETPEETAEDTPEETAEETPEETAEDTPEETAEETPEETAEDTPEETAEDTPEETAEETTEENAEDAQKTAETTDEADSDDVVPDDPQSNAEDVSRQADSDANEKTEIYENASYHQGQNDFGAKGTCGPTSIANSLNRVTGTSDYTENAVLHNAMDNDLCSKSWNPYHMGGTTTDKVVKIIDNVKSPESNVHTEVYEYDKALSVDELADRTEKPGTVAIVGVDSATLWDRRGNVTSSGLFQTQTVKPSDHWITVDSPTRDANGNVTGFNVIDSGGGVSYVDRDKFEAMYMGNTSHKVEDPTAIIVTNQGAPINTYETSEGAERTSNFKGSAMESDGGAPPKEVGSGIKNTGLDKNGAELLDDEKLTNEKFRGDQFRASESYDASFDDVERKRLVDLNASTTCGLNENLDGKLDGMKFSAIDNADILEARKNVPEITPETVMQKVIPEEQVDNYLSGNWNTIGNCCSKAEDTAPYVTCGAEAYRELRLDYKNNDAVGCNVRVLENNADMYVIRFTSDVHPSEIGIPMDRHPCTQTGFIGSQSHLIPEYKYPFKEPSDAAIYKVDANGNETMVGIWDKDMRRFYPVP